MKTLVSNGVIDQAEADRLIKEHVDVNIVQRSEHTEKLRIYGAVQTQYHYINSQSKEPDTDTSRTGNGFQIRRLFFGAYADIGNGFMGVVDLDICGGSIKNAPFLNAVYISKKVESDYINGTGYVGYLKVNFGVEEKVPATKIYSVDRSIVTRYFVFDQRAGSGNVGFGSAYGGVFWDGSVKQIDGLNYGFAVTNAQNFTIKPAATTEYGNGLNFWANVFYASKFDLGDSPLNWKLGLNFGYGSGANSRLPTSGSATENGSIMGVNPYVEIKWDSITFWSELITTNIQHGRGLGTQNAMPVGVNTCAEYLFDVGRWGKAGPILRYSYLNTDGRGARISDCIPGAGNVDASGDLAVNLYDTAQSVYVGANWYLSGHNLKIQAGYEWARFDGTVSHSTVNSKLADVNLFRIQIQVIF